MAARSRAPSPPTFSERVGAVEGVTTINVDFDVLSPQEKDALKAKLGMPGGLPTGALAMIGQVLCVGSGKGGVGKSSLTSNLAVALALDGKKVGILDADVWGTRSRACSASAARSRRSTAERQDHPLKAHGVKIMSIGFFVEEDSAVVWRGPMLHKALTQFLQDVAWGDLDYLLIDLPPGTGDVSMTLAQLVPQSEFLLVTTPQDTAQKVARRAAEMADKVSIPVAGVLENMAGFVTPSGERFEIFGKGGGQALADEIDVPLLGSVPLTMPLRVQADAGEPLVSVDPDDPAAQAVRQAARGLIAMAPVRVVPAPEPVGMSLPMPRLQSATAHPGR